MARFQPGPSTAITIHINDAPHVFTALEHPNAPGMVHLMEGAKGLVYSVRGPNGIRYALKVMKRAHQQADLVSRCASVSALAHLPGMTVCQRYCLTDNGSAQTLGEFPQLQYAILMPWIEGASWYDLVIRRQTLPPEQARSLAFDLIRALARLERDGLAHCDISGGNIVTSAGASVELIDVEDMYSASVQRPTHCSLGTPGYQHQASQTGQWGPNADRFAGAVAFVEMLSRSDAGVVGASELETYFDPPELQTAQSDRFERICAFLLREAPSTEPLFRRAWQSKTFADCPSLGEWFRAICLAPWSTPFRTQIGQPLPRTQLGEPIPEALPTAPNEPIWEPVSMNAPAAVPLDVSWGPDVPLQPPSPPVVSWGAPSASPAPPEPAPNYVWDASGSSAAGGENERPAK